MKKKEITFKNIKWDTDGEKISLPKVVKAIVGSDFDTSLEGADFLSDIFGFCIFEFNFTEKPTKVTKPVGSYLVVK